MTAPGESIVVCPGLVAYKTTGGVDAIETHSLLLIEALAKLGRPARYDPLGLSLDRIDGPLPWCLVQYQPISFGRWGVAPGLLVATLRLRRVLKGPLVLLVHEPWIERFDWRKTVMHVYQRVQLAILLRLVDVVLCSTDSLAARLGPRAIHAPVGSNIKPVTTSPRAARDELGIGSELVITLFGGQHPSRALDHAKAAIHALTRAGVDFRVLNLGADPPNLDVPGTLVDTPGRLTEAEISLRLRATDILLIPYIDGLSTRRGSMMAGLAHGVAIVGHRAPSTDRILTRDDAMRLVKVGDRKAFARAVVELAADPQRRTELGAAGHRLYNEHFDWPVVAQIVSDALDGRHEQRASRWLPWD